jgi:hypothetical protein
LVTKAVIHKYFDELIDQLSESRKE